MAKTHPPGQGDTGASSRLGSGDIAFLVLLALALLAVVLCGRFAYREGVLLEKAKANAQAVAAWAHKLAERKDLALTLARCASAAGESAALQGEADWGSCRQALFGGERPAGRAEQPLPCPEPCGGSAVREKKLAHARHGDA